MLEAYNHLGMYYNMNLEVKYNRDNKQLYLNMKYTWDIVETPQSRMILF